MKLEIHPEYPGNLVSEVDDYLRTSGNHTTPDELAERVKLTPHAVALHNIDDQEITFEELNHAANRIARSLLQVFRGEKDTVGLLFGHTPAAIIAIYSALKAGKIYVPMDSSYPESNLAYYMKDSRAKIVLTDTPNLALAQVLCQEGKVILNVDEIDPGVSDEDLNLSISADSTAAIYYTSGSTGTPKGVIKKNNALYHRPYGFGVGDRQAFLTSFAFTASLSSVFSALLHGVTLYFYPVKQIGINNLAAWLYENQITLLYPPVSLFHQFVEILKDEDFFPHLRMIQLAGERVSVTQIEKFRKHISNECLIKHFLASSESGGSHAFFIKSTTVLDFPTMPAGYPIIGKKVLILDEDGNELPPNQVGEIVVKGRYVVEGYWGEATKDQTKFVLDSQDGEKKVFTGDMGLLSPDGLLEFHGRKDQMVKISGYRVELPLVESQLKKIAGIQDAVVAAREIEDGKKRLVAYIISEANHKPRINEIRRQLSKELPQPMLPTLYVYLDALPMTPSGKIDRNALPEPSQANIAREATYVAPRNNVEAQLAGIWESVLGIHPIGMDDDFFAIGGDSLQAMRIFVKIERMSGRKLPLALLFKASTVAQQAELLQKKDWVVDWSSLVEIQPHGSAPPLFCLPGVGGNVLNFHDLALHLGQDQPCYALQSRGLGMQEEPMTRLQDIAAHHIEVIKTVQPKGPYYICGTSFGGRVAYEMAQQLHDAGESIALVVMFDTYGPNYPKRLPGMTRGKTWLRRRLQRLRKHWINLRAMGLAGQLRYLRLRIPSMFGRLQIWLENQYQSIRHPLPEDLKRVRKANKKASRHHSLPPKFGGRLVLLRASNQPYGLVPDPLLGWGKIAQDRIESIEVEGHHDTLLWEPQVRKAAKVFKQLLDEAHKKSII